MLKNVIYVVLQINLRVYWNKKVVKQNQKHY